MIHWVSITLEVGLFAVATNAILRKMSTARLMLWQNLTFKIMTAPPFWSVQQPHRQTSTYTHTHTHTYVRQLLTFMNWLYIWRRSAFIARRVNSRKNTRIVDVCSNTATNRHSITATHIQYNFLRSYVRNDEQIFCGVQLLNELNIGLSVSVLK